MDARKVTKLTYTIKIFINKLNNEWNNKKKKNIRILILIFAWKSKKKVGLHFN